MKRSTIGKVITFIQKAATGKMVLYFLVPAMIVYSLMLIYTIPQVEQHAQGMKLFDLSPSGYSYEYALELLGVLGTSGRSIYLYHQLPMDFIYPGLFAVSCCLLLSWLFSKSLKSRSKIFYLCLIPVAAGFFDYLENLCIIHMLTSYPNVTESQVVLSSILTILKSGFTTVFFILLVVGIILFFQQKRKDKAQNEGEL